MVVRGPHVSSLAGCCDLAFGCRDPTEDGWDLARRSRPGPNYHKHPTVGETFSPILEKWALVDLHPRAFSQGRCRPAPLHGSVIAQRRTRAAEYRGAARHGQRRMGGEVVLDDPVRLGLDGRPHWTVRDPR